MKNKKLTYFLIVVVAGLWGVIIYRIITRVSNSDREDVVATQSAKTKEAFNDFNIPKDTTTLLLNYRDPFGLVKQKDTVQMNDRRHGKARDVLQVARPSINWSFITYSGFIRNPSSKKLVALVNINGQSVTMAEGETKNQVKLLKNLRDSIKVSYNGKVKFIPLKSSI